MLKKEADVSAVKFEISSLLKQVRKKLPEEVSYPELTGGEVVNDGAPQKESPVKHLLTYQVNSNLKGEQIKEYVEKNVEPVVRAWEEVKSVDVTGGTSKYMEITYDPLIVANYGLTVADVEDGIKSFIGKSDIVGDVMYRDEDGEQSRVTLYLKTSRFARQIGEMPLKTVDGKIIYLNDLATFEYRDRAAGQLLPRKRAEHHLHEHRRGCRCQRDRVVAPVACENRGIETPFARRHVSDFDVRRSQGETVGTGKADYAHVDVVGHPVGVRLVGPP